MYFPDTYYTTAIFLIFVARKYLIWKDVCTTIMLYGCYWLIQFVYLVHSTRCAWEYLSISCKNPSSYYLQCVKACTAYAHLQMFIHPFIQFSSHMISFYYASQKTSSDFDGTRIMETYSPRVAEEHIMRARDESKFNETRDGSIAT